MDIKTFTARVGEVLGKDLRLWWEPAHNDANEEPKQIFPSEDWGDWVIDNLTLPGCFYIRINNRNIISFNREQLLGCCGVTVVGQVYLSSYYPQHHPTFLPLVTLLAAAQGYTTIMATDIEDNPMYGLLTAKDSGFKVIHTFINSRTHNEVSMFVKELSPDEMDEPEENEEEEEF